MKVNKSGFIVTIVFTAIFLVLGIVLVCLPAPYSPVTINGELTVYNVRNYTTISGTLKNTSEAPVTITEWKFEIRTEGESEEYGGDGLNITLQPDEEYRLNYGYYNSKEVLSVLKMTAEIDGKTYTVFSKTQPTFWFGILSFIFAAVFAIAVVATLVGNKQKQKRYDMICANLGQMECHAQFLTGAYSPKGAVGKAVAKSAVSALGGFLMAFLFGFGAYKTYGVNTAAEFVLTDGGLFFGKPNKYGIDLNAMTFIPNGNLPATLTVKKNYVTMKNDANGDVFSINAKNCGITSEQLVERLNAFLHPVKAEAPSAVSDVAESGITAEHSKPVVDDKDDPFGDL